MEQRLPQITNLKLFKTKNLEVSIFDIKFNTKLIKMGKSSIPVVNFGMVIKCLEHFQAKINAEFLSFLHFDSKNGIYEDFL